MLFSIPASAQGLLAKIDLDYTTPGIQQAINLTPGATLHGAVVIENSNAASLAAGNYSVRVNFSSAANFTLGCPVAASAGEIPGDAITPGCTSANTTTGNIRLMRASLNLPTDFAIFADGAGEFVRFDITVTGAVGQTIDLAYSTSASFSISIDGTSYSFGSNGLPAQPSVVTLSGGDVPTPTPTEIVVVPTPTNTEVVVEPTATPTEIIVVPTETPTEVIVPTETPTETEVPVVCADAGYYILTSFGEHKKVGNPVVVTGSVATGSPDFGDMEVVHLNVPVEETKGASMNIVDLAIMDKFGTVNYVENPVLAPTQEFVFDSSSPCGYAVDVEVSADGLAFWVLTEKGAIYKGGDANTGEPQLGNDAATLCSLLGIPFGGLNPRNTFFERAGDGASIRAVGFAVVEQTALLGGGKALAADANANPNGFIVLDSQGGTYLFDGAGNSIRMGGTTGTAANGAEILDRDTVYPFFPGLDIARDIELHPAGTVEAGLVIFDGWGGVHPVPVDKESPVRFLRNETAVGSGILLTTVGLPYLITAFDDPATVANEALSAADVNSIFADIEFCQDGESSGVYTMDKFGGIFAFGSTRATPDDLSPRFSGSPYYFPNLYAEDMEPVLQSQPVTPVLLGK